MGLLQDIGDDFAYGQRQRHIAKLEAEAKKARDARQIEVDSANVEAATARAAVEALQAQIDAAEVQQEIERLAAQRLATKTMAKVVEQRVALGLKQKKKGKR